MPSTVDGLGDRLIRRTMRVKGGHARGRQWYPVLPFRPEHLGDPWVYPNADDISHLFSITFP